MARESELTIISNLIISSIRWKKKLCSIIENEQFRLLPSFRNNSVIRTIQYNSIMF